MTDILQKSLAAMRSSTDGDPELAAGTRLRVRRSLERRARGRRRLIQSSLIVGGLLVSGLSWAISTGRISLRASAVDVEVAPDPVDVVPPTPMRLSEASRPLPMPAPAALTINEAPHAAATIEITREAPKPVPVKAKPIETLYRAAHELHFRGADPLAALAAWDDYLAADPQGRFAIEARYNRALVLVKLKRYADAHAALLPFSKGEIANGYRAEEAKQLVDRLDALNGSPATGY